jgi:radical SAM enzyme (TIGR01210 family)
MDCTPTIRDVDDELQLRRSLSAWSMTLRRSPAMKRPDNPRYVSFDLVRNTDGRAIGRKKVILMSGGCSVPTCTMCPFTNENNYGLDIDPAGLIDQVRQVLVRTEDEPDYEVLALYNDGSFFAPREVPRKVQITIAEHVAASGVKRVIVESLPQFVTMKTLEPFVRALGPVELEVGIGLQSSDDIVRETLVNTRISRIAFERAISVLTALGAHPKIYLMIKPPFLTDAEAITDVLQSVAYVRSLGIPGVTLCPTRVAPNTVAWELWKKGHYIPPNLWTVVETVRRTHETASVRVACINLRGTDFESVFPDSCPDCADRVVDGLVRYSETGDSTDLPSSCACRPALEPAPLDHVAIIARSLQILSPNT